MCSPGFDFRYQGTCKHISMLRLHASDRQCAVLQHGVKWRTLHSEIGQRVQPTKSTGDTTSVGPSKRHILPEWKKISAEGTLEAGTFRARQQSREQAVDARGGEGRRLHKNNILEGRPNSGRLPHCEIRLRSAGSCASKVSCETTTARHNAIGRQMLRAIVAVRAGISWPDAAKGPDYLFPNFHMSSRIHSLRSCSPLPLTPPLNAGALGALSSSGGLRADLCGTT
jgi:hypothetical protein